MAYTSTVLLALLVVATASVGVTAAKVTINGTVTCLATRKGIAGVNVSVSCIRVPSLPIPLAQGVTGVNGTVTLVVNTTIPIPSLSLCRATAAIQARTCNGLPTVALNVTSGLVSLGPGKLSFKITV